MSVYLIGSGPECSSWTSPSPGKQQTWNIVNSVLFTQMRFEPMEILLVTFYPETVLVKSWICCLVSSHTSSVPIIKRSCILACVFICWIFQYFLLVLTHSLFNDLIRQSQQKDQSHLFHIVHIEQAIIAFHCPSSFILLLIFMPMTLISFSTFMPMTFWLYFNFSTEVNTYMMIIIYVCNVIYPV